MEDIRLYDFAFRLLYIIPDVKTAYHTVKYNGIGTFEGTFPMTDELMDVLFSHRYLLLVQGDFQAIITGKQAGQEITVFGKSLNWLLTKRSFPAFKTTVLMKNGVIPRENMPQLLTEAVRHGFSHVEPFVFTVDGAVCNKDNAEELFSRIGVPDKEKHYWRFTRRTLSEIVSEALAPYGCGHRLWADIRNKRWVLEFYCGTKRDILLSEGARNFKNVVLTDDLQDYCTGGWFEKSLSSAGTWNPSYGFPEKDPSRFGNYYTVSYKGEEKPQDGFPAGSYLVCMEDGSWEQADTLPTLSEYVEGTETADISGDLPEEFRSMLVWEEVFSDVPLADAEETLQKTQAVRKVSGQSTVSMIFHEVFPGDTIRVQAEKNGFLETEEKRIVGAEVWWEAGDCGEKLVLERLE